MAGEYGEIDHRLGVVAALLFVAVEQVVGGQALDHQRQLPRQVQGIAHAAVVTLALPYRHDVRGVTGQQHPTLAEPTGQTRVMGIDAAADQLDAVRVRQYLAQQPAQVLRLAQLGLGFAGHHHELETTHAMGQGGGHVRTHGVAAQINMGRGQRVVGDVDHDPLIGRGLAFKADIQAAPHQAVAAIATNQVTSVQAFAAAMLILEVEHHRAVALFETVELTAEQDLDVIEALQAIEQYPVGQRLNERVASRPAELVGFRLNVGEAATLGGQETHGVPRRGMGQHLVRQTDGLESAQAFVVQANGARIVDQAVELFHHRDVDAALSQVIGNHQADRAGADDGNIGGQLQWGRSGCKAHGYLRTALLDFLLGAVWKSRGWWTTKTLASVHQVHKPDL